MMHRTSLRLGTGAGFSSDRLDPAVALVEQGALDTIVFECIGERTLAFGHRDKIADPDAGFNPLLEPRMRAILARCKEQNIRIVTNMGVANPGAAARKTIAIAHELGLDGLSVAAVQGDDVSALVTPDTPLWEGMTVQETGRKFIGANVYLGADALLPALDAGVDVVITGRVADPSLFLAPMQHHFGWATDDWSSLGAGTVVGHLLECAAQVTGGYYADPGVKDVADLAYVGFPIAEINADGSACITKLESAGGEVTGRTVREQLLYEVHDPSKYLTPDVTANFATVAVDDLGNDKVRVSGAQGSARPDELKVTVAFDGGYLAEAGVSYAGPGAKGRAQAAADIVHERLRHVHGANAPLRIDLIGMSSLHASAVVNDASDPRDVRVHCAMRGSSKDEAKLLLWEVESLLCCGPSAGGGYRGQITPSVVTYSASLPRDQVTTYTETSKV